MLRALDRVGADEICPFFSGAFHAPPQNDKVGADEICPLFRAHLMRPYKTTNW